MDTSDLKQRLDFARGAAIQAGEITLRYFLTENLKVITKADESPVTEADRGAEKKLRELIEAAYPSDGIIGEEFGEKKAEGEYAWIIDPIDGTQSFVRGVPLYGVLIGLEREGEAVLGVMHFPALDEMAYGAQGLGAWWMPKVAQGLQMPARVSSVARVEDAMISYTSRGGFERSGRGAGFDRAVSTFGKDRGWSDCYGHLLVATGRVDAMLDPVMKVWDCAALMPIIEEAGGKFTDLEGRVTARGGSAVSSNGKIHDEVIRLLTNG